MIKKIISRIRFKRSNIRIVSRGEITLGKSARLGKTSNKTVDFFLSREYSFLDNTGTIQMGENSRIHETFRIRNKGLFSIGKNSYINPNSIIFCEKSISIGNDCAISWNFQIMDSNFHEINGKNESSSIFIGNNVLIGANVIIIKGVTVGDGAIIGAGSVVTQNIEPYTMVSGNPAVKIKDHVTWVM